MSDGGMNRNSFLPVSGILALIALVGVAIFTQEPLKGIRPNIEKLEGRTGNIDARLWQDPFQAVAASAKKDSVVVHDKFPFSRDTDQEILVVTLPGAFYAEESETRLRRRYAVASALSRLKYYPEDAEHLQVMRYPSGKETGMAELDSAGSIPFEKFIRKGGGSLWVIWINEDLFIPSEASLARMKPLAFFRNLDQMFTASKIDIENINVIGPTDSTKLRTIVKEISKTEFRVHYHYNVYSATATVEGIYLNGEPYDKGDGLETIQGPDGSVSITRTIGSDDALADKLVRELTLRGSLAGHGQIAVISEWDTYYGRHIYDSLKNSLYHELSEFSGDAFTEKKTAEKLYGKIVEDLPPLIRAKATQAAGYGHPVEGLNQILRIPSLYDHLLENKRAKKADLSWPTRLLARRTCTFRQKLFEDLNEDQKRMLTGFNRMLIEELYDFSPKVEDRLHRYSYLRGIDGKVPGEAQKEEGQSGGKDKKAEGEIIPPGLLENPVGKSQYDYLRRLADKIYEEDREFKLKGERGITAIGVLGSDFYDKYLVLQAVRQRLPECIFFTTDLDARYLQADNLRWTRNLVVASHFGFELNGKAGEDMPPFRDSYQTSVFYATLKAFEDKRKSRTAFAMTAPRPHIYEIGRMHAVDLEENNKEFQSSVKAHGLHLLFLGFFAVLLLTYASYRLQRLPVTFFKNNRKIIPPVIYSAVFLFFVMEMVAPRIASLVDTLLKEEPISLFEGISIWPTEILRLSAAFCSILFILLIYVSLRKNQDKLSCDFALAPCPPDDSSDALDAFRRPFRHWKAACRLRSNNFASFNQCKTKEDGISLCLLWAHYLKFGDCRSRTMRVIIGGVLFASVGFCLMLVFGFPVAPSRGSYTWWIDKIILGITLMAFIFLTFLVVDATRLCTYFIRALTRGRPEWPTDSAPRYLAMPVQQETVKNIYGEWMLVDLIARHTEAIQRFIFYPIIVLIMLFLSRSYFFDNWQTPLSLLIVMSLAAIFAWSCVFRLKKAAEGLRRSVKIRLDSELDKEIFKGKAATAAGGGRTEQIKHVAKEVEDTRIGAFALLSQHPLVHSAIVAIGGIGGTALLPFLDFFNM